MGKFIENYLSKRQNISLIILVLDIRHKPTENDLPFMVLTNKADKIAVTKVDDAISELKEYMGISYSTLLPFSAERKIYTENVWTEIEKFI